MSRRALALGLALLAAPAAACSLLVSLDGLAGEDPADGGGEAALDARGDAPVDAGDAAAYDTGPPCAPNAGLQAGSPWPMLGGCVSHVGRSAFVGPSSATTKWKYAAG